MTKTIQALTALQGSIEKWRAILAGEAEDYGTENCPLCQLIVVAGLGCHACPVGAAYPGCRGTPYEEWVAHHAKTHWGVEGWRGGNQVQCPECRRLAEAELEFLQSLLLEEK